MSVEESLRKWPILAKDKAKWYKAQAEVMSAMREEDVKDQWKNRHDEERPEGEREKQLREAVEQAQRSGEWKCPHCQRVLTKYGFRNHVRECTGGLENKKGARAGNAATAASSF